MSKLTENSINYNPVYKVNYLVDNKITTIYVFYGKQIVDKKTKLKFYDKIFTEQEISNINENKINVIFSSQQIHIDDTIGAIKLKILTELKDKVSFDEIYLFCQKMETLNAVSVFQSLTQNKRIPLTKIRLDQFVANIVKDEDGNVFEKPEAKDVYDYDDILEIGPGMGVLTKYLHTYLMQHE
jgi:hypothetical protein